MPYYECHGSLCGALLQLVILLSSVLPTTLPPACRIIREHYFQLFARAVRQVAEAQHGFWAQAVSGSEPVDGQMLQNCVPGLL